MQVKVIELTINYFGFCDKKADDYNDLNAVKQDYPSAYGLAKIDGEINIHFQICEAQCLTGSGVLPENSEFRVFLDDGKSIDSTDFTKFIPNSYAGDQESWRDEVEELLSTDPKVKEIKENLKSKTLRAFPKFKRIFGKNTNR